MPAETCKAGVDSPSVLFSDIILMFFVTATAVCAAVADGGGVQLVQWMSFET